MLHARGGDGKGSSTAVANCFANGGGGVRATSSPVPCVMWDAADRALRWEGVSCRRVRAASASSASRAEYVREYVACIYKAVLHAWSSIQRQRHHHHSTLAAGSNASSLQPSPLRPPPPPPAPTHTAHDARPTTTTSFLIPPRPTSQTYTDAASRRSRLSPSIRVALERTTISLRPRTNNPLVMTYLLSQGIGYASRTHLPTTHSLSLSILSPPHFAGRSIKLED